ncbi:MAG: extracellular solute-binding protein [Clostridia bacterium]|nr:extracellular solute-binding protein [Clostridia bacterium]
MKSIRKISGLLALLLLTTTACGPADEPVDTSADTAADGVTDTAADSAEASLDLPDDLTSDYDTISILTAEGILASVDELTDELDMLDQALYNRTTAVEERLGIDLTFTPVNPWGDTQTLARQSVNSGSDDYQMVFTCAQHMVNLVNEGLFLPLSELPYVDIEKPWWNKEYIESVSILADDPYILFGDISYNMLERTTCVYFNINLLEEKLNMKPEDLYRIVYNGEWTLDKFTEIVSQVYEDANGNTLNDADDIHGFVTYNSTTMNWIAYSAGLEFTSRDEDGYPVIDVNNEASYQLAEKLYKLQFGTESVINIADNGGHIGKFTNGKSLFLINRFVAAGWGIRDMQNDYGILPMPKYDENVDGYHSAVEVLVQWGAVPVTVIDPTFVSAAAEALAYHSRQLTTPAYYETTLKLKLTRDDTSMAMIDMIMDGRDTDFLLINNLEGLGNIFARVFTDGQNNFASNYATYEAAAQTKLKQLIQDFEDARK